MSPGAFKAVGFVCVLVTLGALFVAVERYQANEEAVAAIKRNPMARMLVGGEQLEPATPVATKYAIAVAVLFGLGGAVSLYQGFHPKTRPQESIQTPEHGDNDRSTES
jgi:hypothetical protein